jgi:aminomethyltransferase
MKIATYDWHQSKDAVFEEFFGCQVPSHFGDPGREYRALRESAGLRDVSYFGKIRITGKDSRKFLQGKITNDANLLTPGQGIFATALDIKGHIQADMKIYGFSDHLLMVLMHYAKEHILKFLDRYIISEDVQLKDVTEDYGMLQVLGPQAETLLRQREISDLPAHLYSFVRVSVAGISAEVIRLGAGFALLCAAADTPALLSALDVQPVGMRAFDTFRIESGMPLFKRDFDDSNFPQEARLDSTLNFNKGCYLGQEVMARIDAQGHVNKFLMGIASTGQMNPGDVLCKGEKEIGRITSVTQSPKLGQGLAMGYVRREFAKDGEPVEIGGHRTTGIVKQLPV